MSQTNDFAQAIDIALNEVAKKHPQPELNAVLGALAWRAGGALAIVADDKHRDVLFDQFCAAVKKAMAEKPRGRNAVVKVIGAK